MEKLRRLRLSYSSLNCIGNNHKTYSFKIDNDGSMDLLYKNKINNDTFKITTRFAKLSYKINLEKLNDHYEQLRGFKRKCGKYYDQNKY